MPPAHDPALFYSIYLDKHAPARAPDPRQLVLEEVNSFVETYGLQADAAPHLPGSASGIDLSVVGQTPPDYRLLFRARTHSSAPGAGSFCQCLVYLYSDALVVQFALSRYSDWKGTLTSGWEELSGELRSGFNGAVLQSADDALFGASAVYWTIVAGHHAPEDYASEVDALGGDDAPPLQSVTDLGPLWHCDLPLFPDVGSFSQDLWVLVTARTHETEVDVNKRYYRPRVQGPPDFVVVALAQHKLRFEWQQYLIMRKKLDSLHRRLDEQAYQILVKQARLGPQLDELRSTLGIEFQRKLARAANRLASYSSAVSKAKELRRTLLINHGNYLINSVALLSGSSAAQVIRSRNQEHAAAKILDEQVDDHIFASNLGQSAGKCTQLNSDLDYADSLISRYSGVLRSATDQLQIAGERELGEIAHHISVDSAAVVASVAAILVIELVVKPSLETGQGAGWSPGKAWLALAVVIGSFAVTQGLSSSWRGKQLERYSTALAAGFAGSWVASLVSDCGAWQWSFCGVAWQIGAFLLAFGLGAAVHGRFSGRRHRRHPSPHR